MINSNHVRRDRVYAYYDDLVKLGSSSLGILLAIISCSLAGCNDHGKPFKREESLSVRYPIPALRASMAPFVAAKDQGWYKTAGLDVTFNPGSEALNPVKTVMQGDDQIGVLGGLDTLLVARGAGQLLKAIAILHRNSNFPCLITLKSSGITTLQQLEGKKIGMYPTHISYDVLHSLFRSQHVSVQEINVGYDYSQFRAGKVDAQWAFTTAAAVELPEKGVEVNVISPSDYGIQTQGYTVFAKDEFIKAHPDQIKKFLVATFQGVGFSVDHPAEVTAELVKADPSGNLTEAQVRKRLDQINAVTSHSAEYPPGYMDDQMVRDTYQRLLEQGEIKTPYPYQDAFTREFLTAPAKQ